LGKEENFDCHSKNILQESSQAAEERNAMINDRRKQWEKHSVMSSL
jgi:hypothetical protein